MKKSTPPGLPFMFPSGKLLNENVRMATNAAKKSLKTIGETKLPTKEELRRAKFAPESLLEAAAGPAYWAGKGLVNVAKERFAKNINPFGYEEYTYNEKGEPVSYDPLNRVLRATLADKKEALRKSTEEEMGSARFAGEQDYFDTDRARMDLLSTLMGQKTKYNTLKESKYFPTEGAVKGAKYYDIPIIKNRYIKQINESKINSTPFKGFEDFKERITNTIAPDIHESEKGKKGINVSNDVLGKSTVSFGEDENGYYMSYFDKWDVNPFSGQSSVVVPGADMLEGAVDALSVNKNAPRVYGRIYFDKKTGKVIDDQPKEYVSGKAKTTPAFAKWMNSSRFSKDNKTKK